MGLSFGTTMRKIVIPQAVKNILPTLGNEFISLIKETSVVSFVGAADLYVAFNYHRKQQLRVHGSISGHGNHLHRACPADQLWNQNDGKEPERRVIEVIDLEKSILVTMKS